MKILRTYRNCFLALLVLVSLCLAETSSPDLPANRPLTISRADREKVIFIQDFELDPSNFKQDKGGITGKGSILPPPPPGLPRLRRKSQDPAKEAQKLIALMSESLISNLQKKGSRRADLHLQTLVRAKAWCSAACSRNWTKATRCAGPFSVSVQANRRWSCTSR